MLKILYIEDDIIDLKSVKRILTTSNNDKNLRLAMIRDDEEPEDEGTPQFYLIHKEDLTSGLDYLEQEKVDVILLDLTLPDGSGIETYDQVHGRYPKIPVVVLSGLNDETLAISAVQKGAQDYLVKGQVSGPLLIRCLKYAVERQKMLARLEEVLKLEHYRAWHDSLTDLPNRQFFYDQLRQTISISKRYNRKCAVMFLDLDGFKRVNDTFGHSFGDELLKVISKLLQPCLRGSDVLARLGGDEFTIILREIDKAQNAIAVAKRILALLKNPLKIYDKELYITLSLGISIYPSDGGDLETLVKNADIAMYRAKAKGKNRYQLYNRDMNARMFEYITLENELRKAIDNRDIAVFYQPIVELAHGTIVGAEALVRWIHPEYGVISPAEFIPISEETGLIVEIGEQVIRAACEQMRIWHEKGYNNLSVSVNISPRQFREKNLVSLITRILRESGFSPHSFGLEITELSAMQDVEYTITVLEKLKTMGVQISMDDFGTGYSSLSYLKRFPIDILKIDKSFINDIPENKDDAAITTAIVALARSLDLKVIAEGVETNAQLGFLRKLKCDQMQGFLFSQALPADEFENMIEHNIGLNIEGSKTKIRKQKVKLSLST